MSSVSDPMPPMPPSPPSGPLATPFVPLAMPVQGGGMVGVAGMF